MKINSYTHVHDDERGSVELAPGVVPDWAVALITNPALVVDESEEDADDDADDGTEPETEEDAGPPKKGSSAKKWAAYALTKGFDVSPDATASEIREDLEGAGVATE